MKKILVLMALAVITYEVTSVDWKKKTPEERESFKSSIVEQYFIDNPSCNRVINFTIERTGVTEIMIDCIEEFQEKEKLTM